MEIFLVGGAIRDELLGLTVHEKDWVVVGATPDALISQGYQPVGKDFPVFLHPETHEEYALARTEKKVGKGYKGFTFYAEPDVTLVQDLSRRDLTINAIAKNQQGELIDPYGGQNDLQQRCLRHVSPAFSEDPVRVLRLARFACKLPDFHIAQDTLALVTTMVNNGEVDALVPERVWKELERALTYPAPERFFQSLDHTGANSALWPMIESSAISSLREKARHEADATVRFAALMATLPPPQVKAFCQRYRVPNRFSELAQLASQYGHQIQPLDRYDADALLSLLQRTDALRRPLRFVQFCSSVTPNWSASQGDWYRHIITSISNIDTTALQQRGIKGKAFADELTKIKREVIATQLTKR